MKTKFKNLIVSGCSFTVGEQSWANVLAKEYNLNLVNLAAAGAGQEHIKDSLILWIERQCPSPADTLIGIMWSNPWRHDLMVSGCKHHDLSSYAYDEYTDLIVSGDALRKFNIDRNSLKAKNEISALEIAYMAGRTARISKAWLHMKSLISYLKCKDYTFFQTEFLDFLGNSTNRLMQEVNGSVAEELDRLGLVIDKTHWLPLDHTEILGEYAHYLRMISPDRVHPSPLAQERWTYEILIPKLKECNILL